MKLKCVLIFWVSICVLVTRGQEKRDFVNYLVVRSNSLDRDSCIYHAFEKFLRENSSANVRLYDDYLFLEKYDSLIVLEEENTELGQTIQKVKNATSMAKSILGYNVSSPTEKHDMSLIQPAAELYFDEKNIADTLQNYLVENFDSAALGNAFVVVSLLKVYSNADLLADINRTAKLAGVFTGGLSFVTSSVVKKALSATAGKGHSVIATNLFYKLDQESKTLINVGKTNNYGIIKTVGNSTKDEVLEEATIKALANTEEELLRDYGIRKRNSKNRFNNISSKLGFEQF